MRRLIAATALAALALTACGSDSDSDTTSPDTTAPVAETTEAPTEWTEAMQNACTSEAKATLEIIDALQVAYNTPAREISTDYLQSEGYLGGDLDYWTVNFGKLKGHGDNADGRCGGIYLP